MLPSLLKSINAKYPIPESKPTTRVAPRNFGALFLATRNAVGSTAEINILLTRPKSLLNVFSLQDTFIIGLQVRSLSISPVSPCNPQELQPMQCDSQRDICHVSTAKTGGHHLGFLHFFATQLQPDPKSSPTHQ